MNIPSVIPGVGEGLRPFLPEARDDRNDFPDILPLLTDEGRTEVVRQLTDLHGHPLLDSGKFDARIAVLDEITEIVPTAPYRTSFVEGVGGFVVTKFIEGKSIREQLHGIARQPKAINGSTNSQLIAPTNTLVRTLVEDTHRRAAQGEPVPLDLLRSEQWVVGCADGPKGKKRPLLIDHDAHAAFPNPESRKYDEVARLHIIRLSLIKAVALGMFLMSVEKVTGKQIFGEAIDSIGSLPDILLGTDVCQGEMNKTLARNIGEVYELGRAAKAGDTAPALELRGIDILVRDLTTQAEAAA